LLGISDVPSCRRGLVIYLALVSNHNQGTPNMPKIKIAVLVGSNRRESINRKLAQAIAKLGGKQSNEVAPATTLLGASRTTRTRLPR
jgi:hypothetical protein